ncbi:MAG: hypothetical protein WC443_02315 [Desulfobaccales bacterium]
MKVSLVDLLPLSYEVPGAAAIIQEANRTTETITPLFGDHRHHHELAISVYTRKVWNHLEAAVLILDLIAQGWRLYLPHQDGRRK